MAEPISVRLTQAFKDFFQTEKASSVVLIFCTIISLVLANLILGEPYAKFWHGYLGPLTVEHWINDGLMAIFFLMIGLELKRELYVGELSSLRSASLPIVAAIGGVVLPAGIHLALNFGTPSQAGVGIPMATDIAFAIGILALVGDRVPASLKVFLVALAVMDDLVAIVVIAVFYTADLSVTFLIGAFAVAGALAAANRLGVKTLFVYLIGGALMWYLMLRSGVHATIAGVLLAFTIPVNDEGQEHSPSGFLEHLLHRPVAFIILPIFALANTGIIIESGFAQELQSANSVGIMLGLVLGKPVGITVASIIAVTVGLSSRPLDLGWKHIFGAGLLGGMGFTMSIFIANLAFPGDFYHIDSSKMAIVLASFVAGLSGFIFLKVWGGPLPIDDDPETMDFANRDDATV
ncbi:Na+/H+ antiporter NhaA [soil metagenome]